MHKCTQNFGNLAAHYYFEVLSKKVTVLNVKFVSKLIVRLSLKVVSLTLELSESDERLNRDNVVTYLRRQVSMCAFLIRHKKSFDPL